MSLLPPRFDAWLTTPSEASRNCCAACGERAYDSHDRTDRPHAVTRDGDGVLCSPLCELRDVLAWHSRLVDAALRVAAMREAILAELEVGEVELRIETFSHRHGEGEETVRGYPCDWDTVQVVLETAACESGEAVISWSRVLDAGLA